MARFSTVVTTTTTTTTFSPLFPPRTLEEFDPAQYPLSHSLTPASLPNFPFKIDDPHRSVRHVLNLYSDGADEQLLEDGHSSPNRKRPADDDDIDGRIPKKLLLEDATHDFAMDASHKDNMPSSYTVTLPENPPHEESDTGYRRMTDIGETFDTLPSVGQIQVLWQQLRRCPISTLQYVAGVIAPTLQRDIVANVPVEVSVKILQYLDPKSLCRAGMVSKMWRMIADSSFIWKHRFEEDGYELAEEDIANPYKEIYRRYHDFRNNSMTNVRPRHISFQGHDRSDVTCLHFDSDLVISGSVDSTINIYETRTGRFRRTLRGHLGGVWAMQYLDGVLVSGSEDKTVRVWDIEREECTHIFRGHKSTVRCLQIIMPRLQTDGKYLPEDPIIVTGSRDSTVRVWSLPTKGSWYLPMTAEAKNRYFIRKLEGHSQSVRALSGAGDTLVTGSYDHTVRVWRISTGECRRCLKGHTNRVYSVVYDAERDRCISGSQDGCVKIWDLTKGTNLFTLEGILPCTRKLIRGHTDLVGLVDLSHGYVVSASADSTLRIWDPDTGECRHTLDGHADCITSFQHNGNMVLSGSKRTLTMWDVRTGKVVRDLLQDLSGVCQIKCDERRCVAAVQRGGFTWIDVFEFVDEDGKMVRGGKGRVVVPEDP